MWLLPLTLLSCSRDTSPPIALNEEEAAFRRELSLARADGIATTTAEFKAFIPHATPTENAAPLYRTLAGKLRNTPDLTKIDEELVFHPSSKNRKAVEAVLKKYRAAVEVAERATKLPRCWFDRDWSQGAAVLFPELADMKIAARLVGLRGSYAASKGDVAGALADARRIFAIARHAGEEPADIPRLVGLTIYTIGMRHLADWSFAHRDEPAYAKELRRALTTFPKADLKGEHRGDLLAVLSIVDLCATKDGREKLGLREEDMGSSVAMAIIQLAAPKNPKAVIVKAMRERWAALGGPRRERTARIEKADTDLYKGLLAFPVAAKVYGMLTDGDDRSVDEEAVYIARKQTFVAVARALGQRSIPRTIKTAELPSPFDGKPLRYSFDGRQISIEISGFRSPFGDPTVFKLPPDRVLKAAGR